MLNPLSAGSGQRFELREAFASWLGDMGIQIPSQRGNRVLSQILRSRTWSYKAKGRQGKKSMSVYHYDYFPAELLDKFKLSVIDQAETGFF